MRPAATRVRGCLLGHTPKGGETVCVPIARAPAAHAGRQRAPDEEGGGVPSAGRGGGARATRAGAKARGGEREQDVRRRSRRRDRGGRGGDWSGGDWSGGGVWRWRRVAKIREAVAASRRIAARGDARAGRARRRRRRRRRPRRRRGRNARTNGSEQTLEAAHGAGEGGGRAPDGSHRRDVSGGFPRSVLPRERERERRARAVGRGAAGGAGAEVRGARRRLHRGGGRRGG